jgi:hypothetical protein
MKVRNLQIADSVINVKDFGAKGDGVTDDSAAIQAAVDAGKGKTVYFPGGYTFLAAGISLDGSTYDGTTLRGDRRLGARGLECWCDSRIASRWTCASTATARR